MNIKDDLEEILEYMINELNYNVDPDTLPDLYELDEIREEAKEEIIKLIKEL